MNLRPVLPALGLASALLSLSASEPFPRATPESQGVSTPGIEAFVDAANARFDSLHSFMMLRHGRVIAEGWWSPFTASAPHELASISKSFVSTAVGLAIAEGKLKMDDPVLKYFPDEIPSSAEKNLGAMRIKDLLTMTTGEATEPRPSRDAPLEKTFLEQPVPYAPGTHFVYNAAGAYVLSVILQKVTGEKLVDYLRPRVFQPLGIDTPAWAVSPQGVNLGSSGLKIRTEDMAKFGQLYLQKGNWKGRQLIPASWVEAATARQVENGQAPAAAGRPDWQEGYGYFFWRGRHNTFRASGANGQFVVVMPDQDAVFVVTANVPNLQPVIQVMWDDIFPAIKDAPLPPNPEGVARLRDKLAHLSVAKN